MVEIRIKHIVMVLWIVIAGCTTTQDYFYAKPELIQEWSTELSKTQPFPYPFRVRYSRGKKRLTFFAARHESSSESATFKLIEKEFSQYKYDFILLEGFPTSDGLSPAHMIDWSKSDGINGFFKGGETSFTIKKCVEFKIPFAGGEISDAKLMAEILKTGYSEKDLLYFYFLRQIPQYKRNRTLKMESVLNLFGEFISTTRKDLKSDSKFLASLQDFLRWYREKNGLELDLQDIDDEVITPLSTGKFFTQRLSAEVSSIRDQHTAETMAKYLNSYHNILVVYGGSHWVTQSKIFDDWFGKPIVISNQ